MPDPRDGFGLFMGGMRFCYVDDIKFPQMAKAGMFAPTKAFGFAAYVVDSAGLWQLLDLLDSEKVKAGLHPQDPIKRSMDDGIKVVYKRMYGDDGLDRFKAAKQAANPIGRAVLGSLHAQGAKVYAFLTHPLSATPKDASLSQWAFDMLLQRVGFAAKEGGVTTLPCLQVTVDQPTDTDLLESYRTAFFHGRTSSGVQNYCGSLRSFGAVSSLNFASTPYSPPLQIADFIAGACRDFVRWCQTGKNTKEVVASFGPLLPAFSRGWNGQVEGYGMRLHPHPGFDLSQKIAAVEQLVQAAAGGATGTAGP